MHIMVILNDRTRHFELAAGWWNITNVLCSTGLVSRTGERTNITTSRKAGDWSVDGDKWCWKVGLSHRISKKRWRRLRQRGSGLTKGCA